jgi:hypothetical protein
MTLHSPTDGGHTARDFGVGSFDEAPLPPGRGSLESERGVVVVDRGVPCER